MPVHNIPFIPFLKIILYNYNCIIIIWIQLFGGGMKIKKVENERCVQISLIGRLDATSSSELQLVLDEVFKSTIEELTFDFKELEYVSSAGLRIVLNAQKLALNNSCKMKLINVNKDVMDVFKITGFDEFLTIE